MRVITFTPLRKMHVVNIVGKGENAGNWHFLLIPQCFTKSFLTGELKVVIVWERIKTYDKRLTFFQNNKFKTSKLKVCRGKVEI